MRKEVFDVITITLLNVVEHQIHCLRLESRVRASLSSYRDAVA